MQTIHHVNVKFQLKIQLQYLFICLRQPYTWKILIVNNIILTVNKSLLITLY